MNICRLRRIQHVRPHEITRKPSHFARRLPKGCRTYWRFLACYRGDVRDIVRPTQTAVREGLRQARVRAVYADLP